MPQAVQQSVLVVVLSTSSLRYAWERLTLYHAHEAEEAVAMARQALPDLILLDLAMPGMDGMTLCRHLKDDPDLFPIPVIFLTGAMDLETKVEAFEIGAVDYVTKPFDAVELKARVRSALRTKRYHDLLVTKAQIDALTELWNRGYFDDQLANELSLWARYGQSVALLMADIDHFKRLNDTHGHPFGDAVIQRIAAVLNEASRDTDVVCRYGGEEFAIILRHTESGGAQVIAERLLQQIAALASYAGRDAVQVTMSFGIAGSDRFGEQTQLSSDTLVKAADQALYRAKSNGRNRVETNSELRIDM